MRLDPRGLIIIESSQVEPHQYSKRQLPTNSHATTGASCPTRLVARIVALAVMYDTASQRLRAARPAALRLDSFFAVRQRRGLQ